MQLRPVCLPTQLVLRLLRLWALAMLLQALLPGLRSPKKTLQDLDNQTSYLNPMSERRLLGLLRFSLSPHQLSDH